MPPPSTPFSAAGPPPSLVADPHLPETDASTNGARGPASHYHLPPLQWPASQAPTHVPSPQSLDPLGGSRAHRATTGELAGSGLVVEYEDHDGGGTPTASLQRRGFAGRSPLPVPLPPSRLWYDWWRCAPAGRSSLPAPLPPFPLWHNCRRRDEEIRQSPALGGSYLCPPFPPTLEQQQEDGIVAQCASVCSSVGADMRFWRGWFSFLSYFRTLQSFCKNCLV